MIVAFILLGAGIGATVYIGRTIHDAVTSLRPERPAASGWEHLKQQIYGSRKQRAQWHLRALGRRAWMLVLTVALWAAIGWLLYGIVQLVRWILG